MIQAVEKRSSNFKSATITGLAGLGTKPGPGTRARWPEQRLRLASGSPEVDELVRVRLGIDVDLKITGQLFDRFEALDRESALRLISRNPPDLSRVFHPIFAPELLNNTSTARACFDFAKSGKSAAAL